MDRPKVLKPVDPYTVALSSLEPAWVSTPEWPHKALDFDCPVHSGDAVHRIRLPLVQPYEPHPDVVHTPAQPAKVWEVHGNEFITLTLDPAVVLTCFRGFLFEGNFLITWKAA